MRNCSSTFLLVSMCVFFSCFTNAQETNYRVKQNINENWRYSEHPWRIPSEIQTGNDWTAINLPHSWNSDDATDGAPGYRRSASWYKKDLEISKINSEKQYLLYFEGANITTTVYVNGHKAGGHIGGYIGFTIDIFPHIKKGANEILVRVDNGYDRNVIPSQKSDFFIYGGITRDVWLLIKPRTGIDRVKITTPQVSKATASLKVTVPITAYKGDPSMEVKVVLKNPSGKKIASEKVSVNSSQVELVFKKIRRPQLWDTKTPNLYTTEITLLRKGETIDATTEKVGFRWFEFVENGPFYLNGERLLLRGTHRHEEHAKVGAAMSNELHRRDIERIKEMGANFVRLAHYPQDPEIYQACDELGLLVWDELPWCRGGIGDELWQTNTKNMLKEIIAQNYNHPSIIIWSLGNEMYWLPDFDGGDDTERINRFLTELNTIAHDMDPARSTAMRKYYEGADIVDVFSPSIWSGWYSGSYQGYQKAIDTYKGQYKRFLHAEYGGSSHVGRHSENPITGEGVIQSDGWEEAIVQTQAANIAQIGDWSENYIVDLFDWHLRISETDPTFVGSAQWAFKDFGTPLRPENDIPYMNQKGLVDREGKPKDAYYVFKSYWSDEPFTYIESHSWTDRQGPEHLARNISVFSNCPKVTLYHNGKNLGEKVRNIEHFPASGLNWDIRFEDGENELVAKGLISKGRTANDTLRVNYRYTKNGVAKGLSLRSEKLDNGNYLVTALAVDSKGRRCLDYEDKVYFQCLEGGKTMKHQGTPTGSEIIGMANGKAAIEVVPDEATDKVRMMVLNQNFKGTYLTIQK